MFMNGARIGTRRITMRHRHRATRKGRLRPVPVCCAAAPGAATLSASGRPTAAATIPRTRATAAGFVWLCSFEEFVSNLALWGLHSGNLISGRSLPLPFPCPPQVDIIRGFRPLTPPPTPDTLSPVNQSRAVAGRTGPRRHAAGEQARWAKTGNLIVVPATGQTNGGVGRR